MITDRRVPRTSAGPSSERGSVLLETAFAIPALIAVCAVLLGVFAIGLTSLSLGDTAREAARAAARGASLQEVQADAQRSAPFADVDVTSSGSTITIAVRQDVSLPGIPGIGWTVERSATSTLETFDDLSQ
jgi:Flp pilus assembly protein TadG